MFESDIHSNHPEQPRSLSFKEEIILTVGAVGFGGGISALIHGPEFGAVAGMVSGGMAGGILFERAFMRRAEIFAQAGMTTRAYTEALRASFADAVYWATLGGMAGFIIGGIPGAVGLGALGVLVEGRRHRLSDMA